ncbi:uncharacterized protein [Euphorbia lathyris]|uniref:uncharacterized protein n=1 Tax=Euphorbia lathyris TaxID=212925 RepID=UPI0033139EFD
MKRPISWSDEDDDSSSDESSLSHSDTDADKTKGGESKASQKTKGKKSEGKVGKRKSAVDFDALKRHGYRGGLSVLSVPQPKEEVKEDWTWSSGKDHREVKEVEETYQDRQKTKAALLDGELLANVQTAKEKKSASFSQKEKRKRDLGQASRGKNYVEEEKRLLRESGIYSSFDT